MRRAVHDTTRALLESIVDYAGLFPPAGLGMAETLERFSRYRAGAERWMLGRLVLPVSRLRELEEHPTELASESTWPVTLLLALADCIYTYGSWTWYGHTVEFEDMPRLGDGVGFSGVILRESDVLPEEFQELRTRGLDLGIPHVESGPLVRSSYHAENQVKTMQDKEKEDGTG